MNKLGDGLICLLECEKILKEFRKWFRKSNVKSVHLNDQSVIVINSDEAVMDTMYLKYIMALNKLNEIERVILFWKYIEINQHSNVTIWMDLCMSESTFYRKLKSAKKHFEEIILEDNEEFG